MSDKRIKFDSVIACDEIRQERNGKYFVIGIYTGFIGVSQFPASLRLAFFLSTTPGIAGSVSFEFRILGPGDLELSQLAGSMDYIDPDMAGVIPLPPMAFQVHLKGELKLQYRPPGGEWQTIKAIPIELTEERLAKEKKRLEELAHVRQPH